ncbi:hypothetical protein I3842_13G123500 [Carya illinoinensis]|uniref:GRF-type domain-containing protein n=1 Tax=Carya illinoinensis TaxID=32201 RepID=A0A922D714_CARIL|nr:hypothetical protein I3842_13G123500 [Carya illinoinensis]
MSQSHSSSSLGDRKNAPICLCGSTARLKVSNTSKNPRRPFLTCPNYNKEGKPYCNYFIWADFVEGNGSPLARPKTEFQQKDDELENREIEVTRRENEVQHALAEIHKANEEIHKAKEEIQKVKEDIQKKVLDLLNEREELQSQMIEINHARMLLCVYWGLSILISCILLRSRSIED